MQIKSTFIKTFLWLVFLLTTHVVYVNAAGIGPPTLSSSIPADDAVGVSTTIGLTLIFDETMGAPGTGFLDIVCDGPPMCPTMAPIDCSDFSGNGTNTMSLALTYEANKNYHIEWDGSCFKDSGGMYAAANSSSTLLNFSTGAAPGACTFATPCFSPLDDAVNIGIDSNLTVSFDVNWDYADNYRVFEIRKSSDDTIVQSYAFDDPEVTGAGTTVFTVNPATDLPPATNLYINFSPIKKQIGVGEYEIVTLDNTTWNFTTAYPTGWLSSDWLNRVKITIDSNQINSDLSNFPVYVDLNDLPASFFSNVQNDGSDIRVTLADGLTMLPVEVVSISTISLTGELYFKATSLSSTTDTEFYIYYNNPNISMKNGADILGAQNVWSNDYVGVYHMQQLPGQGNALIWDSTSYRNHLQPNGSMTNTDLEIGKLGFSINFDGTNDFLSAPDSVSLDSASGAGQTRTVSYWIKTTDAANKVILEKGTNQNFVEQINANQAIARTNAGTFATSTTTVNDNNWHLVTHTYSGTTNYIFVDSGSSENSQVEAAPADNNDPLVIGARADSTLPFLGNLDEVRISNIEKNADWISAEFINQNTPNIFYTISAQEGVNDNSNPKISNLYPSTQSIQHPIRHPLKMIFNEVINIGNGNINIHNYNNDVIFETLDVNNASRVNGNGTNTLRFTTSSNLLENTKYYVLIDYGAIEDTSSNQFSGIWNKDTWVFTTQGRDSIKKHQIFILDGN